MKNLKFGIIGAGAVGQAMAGHLAFLGCDVSLYNRSAERIMLIQKRGRIKLAGKINGIGRISTITSDIKEIVARADIVIVGVPAYAHRDIAKRCVSCLRDDQIILLTPGRTGGAIEFAKTLQEENVQKRVIIAEAQTALHTCRLLDDTSAVMIFAVKRKVPLAAFPASETTKVIQILQPLFPQFKAAENVLVTSLGNVGAILHPTPTLLNIGWIETLRTQFLYYYEGITPSIATFLENLDRERIEVAKALDVKIPSVQEWLYNTYSTEGATLYDAIQNNESYREIYAPQTINCRYIYEDIPTGLVPISSLGDKVGVKTLNMNIIIDLACKVCGVNFWKRGRTVESLGLNNLSVKQIKKLVRTGYPIGKN